MFSVRPSDIHGKGCFTKYPLEEGSAFCVPNHVSFDDDHPHNVWVDNVPYFLLNHFTYMNHSDLPTAELYIDENDEFRVRILKNLEPGEEITIDYGEEWNEVE